MPRHFGLLIPSTNTTAEIEYRRLLPESLQPHYARLGKGASTPFSPSLDDDVAYQSRLLGNAKVEVVALLQTSASLFEEGYDARIKALMSEAAGTPSITSAEAIGEAVQALGADRIALVSPYSEAVIEQARRYYETRYGLEVRATAPFGATDAYAIGGLSADNATDAFRRIDDASIEVLVVPGGNFPSMAHVAGWEREFRKPVITTNQAVIWGVMQHLGHDVPLQALGALLDKGTSTQASTSSPS